MTHLETAIRDAVEKGGYPEGYRLDNYGEYGDVLFIREEDGLLKPLVESEILLDPAFWRALGKARGWGKIEYGEISVFDIGPYKMVDEKWLVSWHRFIDHLIAGGDIESFFASL